MKIFLGFLVVLIGTVNHAVTAGTSDQASKIFKLVAGSDEQKFCAKGLSFIIKTIRSHDGAECTKPLGAAVALGICEGVEDFDSSACSKKAIAALKKSFPDVAEAPHRAALTVVAADPVGACKVIAKFLPMLAAECNRIATNL